MGNHGRWFVMMLIIRRKDLPPFIHATIITYQYRFLEFALRQKIEPRVLGWGRPWGGRMNKVSGGGVYVCVGMCVYGNDGKVVMDRHIKELRGGAATSGYPYHDHSLPHYVNNRLNGC